VEIYFEDRPLNIASSYLDFHLLIYLAKLIDIKAVENLIDSALNEKPISERIITNIENITN